MGTRPIHYEYIAKLDLSGTVELILRLQPGTREILVVSGSLLPRSVAPVPLRAPSSKNFKKKSEIYLPGPRASTTS